MLQADDQILPNHHVQQKLCETRPTYRQGRKLTAIKVYSVNSESQHLYIYGVPSLNLRTELKNLCTKYGQIEYIHAVKDVNVEQFTECYHVCYKSIQSARISKRFVDNKNFYGGILHVCYVPEYETVEQSRQKIYKRKQDVLLRISTQSLSSYLHNNPRNASKLINSQPKRKSLHSDYNAEYIKKFRLNSDMPHSSTNINSLNCTTESVYIGPQICDFNSKVNADTNEILFSSSNSCNMNFNTQALLSNNNNNQQKKIVFKNKYVKLL